MTVASFLTTTLILIFPIILTLLHPTLNPLITPTSTMTASSTPFIQPTYFLCHGSPFWLVEPTSPGPKFLSKLGKKILSLPIPQRPKTILMFSAHWETQNEIRVTTKQDHTLLYDYYGFPKSFYDIQYPAKGDGEVSERAKTLLKEAGFKVKDEDKRGLDHGVFTPLLYMFPNQELPVVVVSLPVTSNPQDYLKLGESLKPLRSEGVMIIGGGFATHNLMEFRTAGTEEGKPAHWASSFIDSLETAILKTPPKDRNRALLETYNHEFYRKAHPSPEHYAPVLVAAGAGGEDDAKMIHSRWGAASFSEDSFVFGESPL
ncbi:hypothetical protein HDU97_005262 [Phlyctochytrium planicorne]|nr:hypothetical protein HDU97_005262 [Phlyctochytrium planicorne]